MEREQAPKRKRIHLDVVESVALSQTEEGSISLRQPVDRNRPGVDLNQRMKPHYIGRTKKQFQPPQKVQFQKGEDWHRPQAQQNIGKSLLSQRDINEDCSESSWCGSSQNSSDKFDLDCEALEQKVIKSGGSQSVCHLGGFISAAQIQQDLTECSFSSLKVDTALKSSWNQTKQKKHSKKLGARDANQSSITSFMSFRSSASGSSSDSDFKTCRSFPDHYQLNKMRQSRCTPASTDTDKEIVYNSSSKLYSPIKQISDSVYVISDDSNSDSSPIKAIGTKTTPHSHTDRLVAKQLFIPHFTQNSTSLRSAGKCSRSGQTTRKRKRTSIPVQGLKSLPGAHGQMPVMSQTGFSNRVSSSASSAMHLQDDQFTDSPASLPVVRQDIQIGKTFGLLNDSSVTLTRENYFEKLPLDVIENIFSGIPMLDLCQSVNRVCLSWNSIISNPKFIPWKKNYHRLKLGESDAKNMMQKVIAEENMKISSLRLLHLISYMQKFKKVAPNHITCELLKQHPKYTWAMALLREKVPHCLYGKEANPWSVICSLVLIAATVQDLIIILQLLTSARSSLMCLEVLECFYCMATFLLAFKQQHLPRTVQPLAQDRIVNIGGGKKSSVVNGLHYRLFYALYLFENTCASNHLMLQEAISNLPGQQSIVKYSRGDTPVRLTHEQMRIIKYTPGTASGEVIKIFAFAGSGKTTTLVRYAQLRPHLKFLLIVFNKSVCTHAQSQFPANVTCKTGHGLAFGFCGRRYAAAKKLNPGNLRVYDVAMALHKRTEHKENLFIRAKFVMETLKNYLSSEDEDITSFHAPSHQINDSGQSEPIPHDARMRYAEDATYYWTRMKNIEDLTVKMTHDGYLKLYQLTKPLLKAYDIILIDEAQDLTPALLNIVQRQRQPRIYVGDQHQQIYAFRGAVNAMQGVTADHIFYLTQSFRFGPNIAQVANTLLETLKDEQRKNIVGHAAPDSINGDKEGQVAVLCRSNFTVFAEAVTACVYSDQPIRVSFVGGLDGFGFSMLQDIYTLMLSAEHRQKERNEIKNPFIARFHNVGDLEAYATKTMDVELLGKIRIVRTYSHNLPMCVSKITQKAIGDTTQADMVFSTVHKAKGLEFATVKVTDDFISFHDILTKSSIEHHMISIEEANLLYVAVTRAKKALIMSRTLRTILSRMGGGCYHPVHTDQLKKDGMELTCLGLKKEFKPQALTLYRPQVTLSNKCCVAAGVLSPELVSNLDSEYAHLLGNGFQKVEMDDENALLVYEDDDWAHPL